MSAGKPFWSRAKVGIAAGIVGLSIGAAGAGEDTEAIAAADSARSNLSAATKSLTAAQDEKSELESRLVDAQGEIESAVSQAQEQAAEEVAEAEEAALAAQDEAVRKAVAKVRSEEQRKREQAVAAAVAAAQASAPTSTPQQFASTGGGTDPQFSYCYEANDAGYGPYVRGQDPEYDWYDDRDGDGVVCET